MILEAFSERLHQEFASGKAPEEVLHAWLHDILSVSLEEHRLKEHRLEEHRRQSQYQQSQSQRYRGRAAASDMTRYHVASVLHQEIAMNMDSHSGLGPDFRYGRRFLPERPQFSGRSPSGQRLLLSLYTFCKSYEQWQFGRWLHDLKASDFQYF